MALRAIRLGNGATAINAMPASKSQYASSTSSVLNGFAGP